MAFENVKIRSTRNGGTPIDGYRDDLAISDLIGLSLTSTVGVTTFKWEIIGRPEGSSAGGVGPEPIQLGTSSTASFTVDTDIGTRKDGTYTIQCTVNAGSPTETRIPALLCRLAPGITISGGRALRKLGGFEAVDDTSIATIRQGWANQMNRWLELLRQLATSGVPTSQTLAQTYAQGTSSADQTATLLDGDGGGVVLDGSSGSFTGTNSLSILGPSAATILAVARTGGVGLGTAASGTGPSVALANGSSVAVSAANTGRIRYNTTGQQFEVSTNGGAYAALAVSGFTAGSVIFAGSTGTLAQDNANFFWDDTNNRLGIGLATPLHPLHVRGSSASTTITSAIENAADGTGAAAALNILSGASPTLIGSIIGYGSTFTSSGAAIAGSLRIQVDTLGGIVLNATDSFGEVFFFTGGSLSTNLRLRVDGDGNIVPGTAALATTATNGFIYNQTAAGTPTGTPATYTGRAPTVWDSANNILYLFSGGSWRGLASIGPFTAGSVIFSAGGSTLAQNNTQLFWDDFENRLGIGTNVPSQPLHIAQTFNGDIQAFLNNTTDGSAAKSTFQLQTSSVTGGIQVMAPSFTAVGAIRNNSLRVFSSGAGGLILNATGASGPVRIYTGGLADANERLRIDQNGNIVPGTGALSTSATDGFIYSQGTAGVPTGTPTSFTGRVPFVYNTVGNQLYFYNGSWMALSGISEPADQIVFGTGGGVDSSASFRWDDVGKILTITDSVFDTSDGALLVHLDSVGDNFVGNMTVLRHTASGGPGAVGLGVEAKYQLETASSTVIDAASMIVAWDNATVASARTRWDFTVREGGAVITQMRLTGGKVLARQNGVAHQSDYSFIGDDTCGIRRGSSSGELILVSSQGFVGDTMWLNQGRVGIGATPPSGQDFLIERNTATLQRISSFNSVSTTTTSNLRLFRARGTAASPTANAANDVVGNLFFSGRDSTSERDVAVIKAVVINSETEIDAELRFGTGLASTITEHWKIDSAGDIRSMVANNSIYPFSDNGGSELGNASLRWSLIRGVTITSGDYELGYPDSEGEWVVREGPENIYALNKRTGKKYRLAMEEIADGDYFPQKYDPEANRLTAA